MAELIAAEDDRQVRTLVAHLLTRAGHHVREAENGAALRLLLDQGAPDLVVLDVTLPDEDGLSLARHLRALPAQPGILLLSGHGDTADRIAGLEAGADDYLVKPCEPEELLARVDMILRRRRPADDPPRLGPWRIDAAARTLAHADGRTVRLTRPEFELLQAFASHPGRIFSREELLDLAPGRDDPPFDRSIDHRIGRLRRKLGDDGRQQALISAVRGRGYRYRI